MALLKIRKIVRQHDWPSKFVTVPKLPVCRYVLTSVCAVQTCYDAISMSDGQGEYKPPYGTSHRTRPCRNGATRSCAGTRRDRYLLCVASLSGTQFLAEFSSRFSRSCCDLPELIGRFAI